MLTPCLTDKPLYTAIPKWNDSPRKPVSLYDIMNYLNPYDLARSLRDLIEFERDLYQQVEGGNHKKRVRELWPFEVMPAIEAIRMETKRCELKRAEERLLRIDCDADLDHNCTIEEMHRQIAALREAVEDDLRTHVFLPISPKMAGYCDQENLFGGSVSDSFPSAIIDIREAGNCLAVGLNTACVFHLMRVLESGLKVLAVEFKLPCTTEAWGRVIGKIEDAITELQKPRNKDAPNRHKLQFYCQCAIEFKYFKDAWRNHAVHERIHYDDKAAVLIFEHVRNFMRRLSLDLKE
jgi:hypothetical protein